MDPGWEMRLPQGLASATRLLTATSAYLIQPNGAWAGSTHLPIGICSPADVGNGRGYLLAHPNLANSRPATRGLNSDCMAAMAGYQYQTGGSLQ